MATLGDLANPGAKKNTKETLTVGAEHMMDMVALDTSVFTSDRHFIIDTPSAHHEQLIIEVIEYPIDMKNLNALHIGITNAQGDPVNTYGDVVTEPPSYALLKEQDEDESDTNGGIDEQGDAELVGTHDGSHEDDEDDQVYNDQEQADDVVATLDVIRGTEVIARLANLIDPSSMTIDANAPNIRGVHFTNAVVKEQHLMKG